ncbi:hypothetical protein K2Q16_03170 [Patescibacteria group bacterium]|nr:hypothetical protein [Patescibacteria group bacterium]
MRIIKIVQILLAIVSGALLIGYGGMDDSPGTQGIGLLTIVSSVSIGTYSLLKKTEEARQ